MSAIARASVTIEYRPQAEVRAGNVIAFGEIVPGALHVPVRQLGPEPRVEILASDGLLFGAVTAEETKPLETISRETYARLIQQVRDAGFPYFVRMWNFVGSINESDERERYQLFCAGRHDAFVAAGYHHDVDLPSASAVGMRGRGLITYFLAARDAGVQVENPRQIAAYNYPPQYGPKSPSFSRATVWRDMVFVSGTSSVLGHATVHVGDVEAQIDETMRNIEAVLARTDRTLANVMAAKTFVRNAADYDLIARRLADVFPTNLYLEADICRKDLLLEIECVAR
ncbi:MAG TPA: Rid family hydrolase [Thermoanaerobaculia bacterium]|jgi:chorismate lyase/3-hydroxybenzoate synthase|nr:Rid family hydrolase [Thermoanaerobaculia bacterium]